MGMTCGSGAGKHYICMASELRGGWAGVANTQPLTFHTLFFCTVRVRISDVEEVETALALRHWSRMSASQCRCC
jgi:hypothetical protein